MREIQVRADVTAEIAQILIRPGGADLAVEARLRMLAVPAHSEAVAVGARRRFEGFEALHHQRMGGRGHILFKRDGLPAVSDPAAHQAAPGLGTTIYHRPAMRQSVAGEARCLKARSIAIMVR